MRRCIFLVGLLLIVGCQSGTDNRQTSADTTSTASSVTGDVDSERGEAAQAPAVALDPQGLRLVDPPTGSTHMLTFGMDEDDVISAVASLRGEPAERTINSECGPGPLVITSWADGLTLSSSQGRFSGWGVNDGAPGAEQHTTVAGIGIGSTRTELEESYDIRTGETSLGTEFAAGELHGVLDGTGSDAEITAIWSGTTCVFR